MADPAIPAPPAVDPQRRRIIAVTVTSVVALAIAAAVVGWVIGSNDPNTPVSQGSATPTPSASVTASPTPTSSPTATPTSSATQPGGLPNYTGRPLTEVFADLRAAKLGVNVVFEGDGDDQTVSRTEPAAGTKVNNGTTVKVYVKGSAPVVTVPDVTGKSCSSGLGTAGNLLFEAGLKVIYAAGERDGVVTAQTPDPTSTTTRWNDGVTVTCGTTPPTDQPSAAAG